MPPDPSEKKVGGGIPRVAFGRLVSDALGLVETLGAGGSGEPVGAGDALVVDGGGVDPERPAALFNIFENRFPFFTFVSASVEGVGKSSVGGVAGRGRSSRVESTACGGGTLFGAGPGRIMGWFGGEALLITGSCALFSEVLRA
jgi:hypothetical protein